MGKENGRLLRCHRINAGCSSNNGRNVCARGENQIRHYLGCDSTPADETVMNGVAFIGGIDDKKYVPHQINEPNASADR